jgi:hypothetical protein
MFLAPLRPLRGAAQAVAACCLLGAPLTYVFQVKSEEGDGARIANENRKPLVRHAVVSADLNSQNQAPAVVDGELAPVMISAPQSAPRHLKGRTVLVFYCTTRGCWRFISDQPEQLDPSTMDFIEAFPADARMELANARQPTR